MIYLKYAIVKGTKQRIRISIPSHSNNKDLLLMDTQSGKKYKLEELILILSDADSKNECYLNIALSSFSDNELRQELKVRANVRKAMSENVFRCRNCRYCIQGYTSKRAALRGSKTSVCEMSPKDNGIQHCFYATLQSRKACEMFQSKENENTKSYGAVTATIPQKFQ